MCSHYESTHEGHVVKPVQLAIEIAETQKSQLVEEGKEVTNLLENTITQYKELQESMKRQKDLYLRKLEAEFDLITKVIELRKQSLTDDIKSAFEEVVSKNQQIIEKLMSYKLNINELSTKLPKVDIDILNVVKQLDTAFTSLSQDPPIFSPDYDLTPSLFTPSPLVKIQSMLEKF